LKKTNAKGFLVSKSGLGGDPYGYLGLAFFDSFADLAQFPEAFRKASAEAKLAPMPTGVVMRAEYTVIRFVPELSIQPAAQ